MTKMLVDMETELKFEATKVDVAQERGPGLCTRPLIQWPPLDPKTQASQRWKKGNYVTVYKKQADGSWKIIEDINATGLGARTSVQKQSQEARRQARGK